MILADIARRDPEALTGIRPEAVLLEISDALPDLINGALHNLPPSSVLPPTASTYIECAGPHMAELIGLQPDNSEYPKVAFNTNLIAGTDISPSGTFNPITATLLFEHNVQQFIPNAKVQIPSDTGAGVDELEYAYALSTVLTIKTTADPDSLHVLYVQTHLDGNGHLTPEVLIAPADAATAQFTSTYANSVQDLLTLLLRFYQLHQLMPYEAEPQELHVPQQNRVIHYNKITSPTHPQARQTHTPTT